MEYAIDVFERQVRESLAATQLVPDDSLIVEAPRPGIAADLTFAAFRIARERGLTPAQLAEEIASRMRFEPDSLAGSVVSAGPYVNVSVDPGRFAAAVLADVERHGDTYGHDDIGSGQTVVIDSGRIFH